QPWYKNTIFVLTSDHTNMSDHDYYQTALGSFCSPIIFFDPSGKMETGMKDAIAQQIDIMPTLLNYLGYDKPYIAFGKDLLGTPEQDTWAVNYNNGIYQFVQGDYLLQFDGKHPTAFYNYKQDILLKHNLIGKVPQQKQMELMLKAIIQQYMDRMVKNQLSIKK
ncbi:MAG: LTA synthase family protein, partial [Prevotella sp.]|nr:LTA synthase family protein [Prevotella sp.]